ncbi:MAG: hypothetical protein WD969_07500 [Paracoccaceae bacterium]
MFDPAMLETLAELRRRIDDAERSCDRTLRVISRGRGRAAALAPATPFLSACAQDLECLAGAVRRAAAEAGAQPASPD